MSVQALRYREQRLHAAASAVLGCQKRYAWQGWRCYVRARVRNLQQNQIAAQHALGSQRAKAILARKVRIAWLRVPTFACILVGSQHVYTNAGPAFSMAIRNACYVWYYALWEVLMIWASMTRLLLHDT